MSNLVAGSLNCPKLFGENPGFSIDFEEKALSNCNFREVPYTTPSSQLAVMALKPGEKIGAGAPRGWLKLTNTSGGTITDRSGDSPSENRRKQGGKGKVSRPA